MATADVLSPLVRSRAIPLAVIALLVVTIVRDRVRALIGRGMTLAQVKAARPSSDYDPEFGGTGTSSPDAFVESIHRSLGGK